MKRVRVDFGVLDPVSGRAAKELAVDLFDGQTVILDRARIESRGQGNYTWHGRVRGYSHSDAVLTVVAGRIAGSIVIADEAIRASATYQVVSETGDTQALRLLDAAAFPPDHPPGAANAVTAHAALGARTSSTVDDDEPMASPDGIVSVDLMVLYSNQAAAAAGATIAAEIQHAIDRANLAYANSGIAARLRLVHYRPANYAESGDFQTDLDRLTGTADGYMDGIHTLRDSYGADLVSLFVENGDYCGLGWINADAGHGFTVISRGCASGNLSLAHEIGHNFGARHDLDTDAASTPFAYGHGYVYVPGSWRTVMAYNPASTSCTRIAYFSNPGLSYGSPPTPMGVASTSDVARVHNERAATLARFRQATAAAAPASCTATANPGLLSPQAGLVEVTGSCADGPAATTWTWVRNSVPIDLAQGSFTDTIPPNATTSVATYTYSGTACNSGNCAPPVSVAVTVLGLPAVTTNPASGVTASSATLNGAVSSNGAATSVAFQYGLTTGYGSTVVAAQSPLAATATTSRVSAAINGLQCGTTYHFLAVAANAYATSYGGDTTFTTGSCIGSNADLAGIALSTGTLSPPFARDTLAYAALVVSARNTVTVTPSAVDARATIRVNGAVLASGSPTPPIALNPGNNAITIVVTAQDGVTTRTYAINVSYAVDTNAVTVVEFYNAALDHYFITWLPDEIAALDAGTTIRGWQRTGHAFQAYPVVREGTSPVCRYYIPPALGDSHFFGRGTAECAATGENNPGLVLEDPLFMQMYLPAGGVCLANTTPVYRVFSNRGDANHRYTTDRAERAAMVAKGWLAEGDGPDLVVMCAPQ